MPAPRMINPAYPPLTDDELDVLDGYLALRDQSSGVVALDRRVVARLMSSAAAYLMHKQWSDRFGVDQDQWLHLREQINLMPDESAKIALHRLLNAAIKPGVKVARDQPPTFAGEGNPTTPGLEQRVGSWDRDEATAAALAAARRAIPPRLETFVVEDADVKRFMTVEPEHYPEDGTSPRLVCICGKPWPHVL